MDYQSNSKKAKEAAPTEKKLEKVVTTEVVSKPQPLGRKFKSIFVSADFRSVAGYVFEDVLIPAFRNMIVDASTKGIERVMYGESRSSRPNVGPGPRITYNNPISRSTPGRSPRYTNQPQVQRRGARNDVILVSREEAELVLERLHDCIDSYDMVSVADLNDLLGLPATHVDNKWGWTYLGGAEVRQIREGYLLDLPPEEPI